MEAGAGTAFGSGSATGRPQPSRTRAGAGEAVCARTAEDAPTITAITIIKATKRFSIIFLSMSIRALTGIAHRAVFYSLGSCVSKICPLESTTCTMVPVGAPLLAGLAVTVT